MQQSLSQRESFCGPVAQAVVPRNSPVVLRNRDPYPRLPLRNRELSPSLLLFLRLWFRNQGLFLSQSLRCQMARVRTGVMRQRRQTAFRLLRLPLHRHLLLCSRRNLDTRLCMISQDSQLVS